MLDVKKLLDDQGIPIPPRRKNTSPGWINIRCPFCDDKSNHLGINLESNICHCWKCGRNFHLYAVIQEILSIPYQQARKLCNKYLEPRFNPVLKRRVQQEVIVASKDILPKEATKEMPEAHRQFLINRRYNPDFVCEKYDLYFCGMFGKWKGRIIIPIKVDDQIVSFVGWAILPATPKYKVCPDALTAVPRKQLVYGIDSIRNRKCLIVEGIADAWRMGDGAVAILTTSFSQAQVNLLAKKADQFYIMLDSKSKDPNAPRMGKKLGNLLASIGKQVEILYLDKGDPDDLSEAEATELKKLLQLS